MQSNPFLGVLFHAVGGVAHGTFYAPLNKVRRWAWESYWLIQGVAAWVVTPWAIALLTSSNPLRVLLNSPSRAILLTYLFGAMWGFGSLTFGLSMRYLGLSLGMAVAEGYCIAFGTLIPPLVAGQMKSLTAWPGGVMVSAGIAVCLAGIGLCGYAGIRKERELTEEQQKAGVKEFALGKGFLVATFSGIMSAGFAYGVSAGKPIAQTAFAAGTPNIFKNAPVFIVIMAGGFTVNCIWCLLLNIKNRTLGDYFNVHGPAGRTGNGSGAAPQVAASAPLLANYVLCASAGAIWYTGFFFYGMGTTKMGQYDFTSWSIHLAFVIVFSTLAGLMLKEWKGVGRKTLGLVWVAIAILIGSTILTAVGNYISPK